MEGTSNGGHIGSRKKMVIMNETVSLGDTAIGLHTLQLPPLGGGGLVVVLANSNPNCQDLSKSAFLGELLLCYLTGNISGAEISCG